MKPLVLSVFALLLVGCGQTTPDTASITDTPNPSPQMTDSLTALIQTNQGTITVQLLPQEAPGIVKNFVDLAEAGKYDGTIFHRVIKDFMIQGGDYENRNGTGGQAAQGGMIADEFSPNLSHVRGALSMANRGPNTNGSQFFIVQKDQPHLDGRHSIFGQVTEGMDVVDAITDLPQDGSNKPLKDVVVETITIVKK